MKKSAPQKTEKVSSTIFRERQKTITQIAREREKGEREEGEKTVTQVLPAQHGPRERERERMRENKNGLIREGER